MTKREKLMQSLLARVPKDTVNQFLSKEKTPLSVMLMALIVGIMAGLIGTAFELAVHFIADTRTDWLRTKLHHIVPLWLAAFVISALLALVGYYLVHKFAPEAAGSGIPEIEGAMDGIRPMRWWRVIPVKFLGGLGTLGAGMVLGREGPTVQMGGAIGRMVTDLFNIKCEDTRHSLLAAGAAGGLAAAFNAPLAGIMFVVEEMRPQFRYSLISIRTVIISSMAATIVYRAINSQHAVIDLPQYHAPGLSSLWLFLLLGAFFGAFGVIFNRLVTLFQDMFARIHKNGRPRFLFVGAMLGGFFGITLMYAPQLAGDGTELIRQITSGSFASSALLLIFIGRIVTTMLCFGSGAPGGIFAPMLALGTLFGYAFGLTAQHMLPGLDISPGMFAIAGMGALFAATVRAPITGILLVIEMTNNYYLILPLVTTCLGAVIFAQWLGGKPIYSQLLHRTLKAEKLHKEEYS